jgi:hypothetical protein
MGDENLLRWEVFHPLRTEFLKITQLPHQTGKTILGRGRETIYDFHDLALKGG